MYKRAEYQTIKNRIEEQRRFIQVVMGARQIGKSTVVKQVLKDLDAPYQFFSADNVPATNSAWISNCWAAVRSLKESKGQDSIILVIDEIQKIANWSEVVKKEWDDDTFYDRNIKVLLLGSSRVLLEKGLSESLAGRFEEIRMSHWSYQEMKECFGFSLDQYLFYGGYPGAASLIDDNDRFQQYIQSSIIDATINKDILMDTPISKPALLRQTFELGAAYSGSLLSLNKMLGSLQDAGNTATLAGYINLLDESGLLCGLQKFSMDMARRKASIPKLQVYNNALKMVYSSFTFQQAILDRKIWGHIFESGIGAYLVSQAFIHRFEVFYWRERNDEVDFILRKKGSVVAIEVKSNAEKKTEGLDKFRQLFNPQSSFIVGDGGIAVEDFFLMDIRKLF
ncbi:putative AAA+ superfamily ATPase [Parabacteroides sp. PFB2-12]|uniref:ATP-binding protein n=1 Tax=unclassified Parabacteroides TaxID=2649774 RepID=UPI0024745823|nr:MULTISPECIES: ATP-binding protein [unclassified Parabacteroides]MDH6344134.1 putative AAA+ superfamily ATPase [Parabacteroides sp. PM6-13]MDH6392041.1 putative AAA+ superfamily ATPase [Parabacteroides sp. PFB2-12]